MKLDLTANGFVFKEEKVLLIFHKNYKMWIGAGGHIDPDETPDDNVIKEMKEELGLDVEILSYPSEIKVTDNTIRNCPLPFHADVHDVKTHQHYAQYYICVLKDPNQAIIPEENEIKDYKWFTEEEILNHPTMEAKTKAILKLAFRVYKDLKKINLSPHVRENL